MSQKHFFIMFSASKLKRKAASRDKNHENVDTGKTITLWRCVTSR